MPTTPGNWKRLGDLLVQRRIELDPRYRVREVFAAQAGIHPRMLYDIERAKRTTFPPGTLATFEVAYQWAPGSIKRVLDGGAPLPLEDNGPFADFTAEEIRIAIEFIRFRRQQREAENHQGQRGA